jgi:hypothetical protein
VEEAQQVNEHRGNENEEVVPGGGTVRPPAGTEVRTPVTEVPPTEAVSADSMTADREESAEVDVSANELPSGEVAAEDDATATVPQEITEASAERLERIKQLAKVYEQMNATSVAAIVTNMREQDAVDILSNMKPRNAAKVLASLEPERAATLSLRLTE